MTRGAAHHAETKTGRWSARSLIKHPVSVDFDRWKSLPSIIDQGCLGEGQRIAQVRLDDTGLTVHQISFGAIGEGLLRL